MYYNVQISPFLFSETKSIDNLFSYFSIQNIIYKLFNRFLTFLIKKVHLNIIKLVIHLEGLKVIINSFDKDECFKTLPDFRNFKLRLFKLDYKLEKINYFDNSEIKNSCIQIIHVLNDIEIQLKKKAFSGNKTTNEKSKLAFMLATKSNQSLSKLLAQ